MEQHQTEHAAAPVPVTPAVQPAERVHPIRKQLPTHLPRKDEVLSARGRSLGGFSTWNHLRADQHGQPLAFVLNPGKAANRGAMKALMEAMAMPSRTLDGHEFRARNLRTEKSQQPLGIAG